MRDLIKQLYPLNRCLMGEGYHDALKIINKIIPLQVTRYPTGNKAGTWTVPEEWVVRDAWVKFKGEKIIDYKKDPLSLVVGSLPFSGKVTLDELKTHLHYSDEQPDAHLYEYKFYERDWGFTMPRNKIFNPSEGDQLYLLEEGEYEVMIDTEYHPGMMRVGVHTIPGKSAREILLIAHLDHPYQANDNLSGVAVLVDLAKELKCDHTIKIIFCPETIGSIAYAHMNDLSNVDFVIALDCVGNLHAEGFLLQKAFDRNHRVNVAAHLALRGMGLGYRQGIFRSSIGSDEYVFNDPKFGIPGIMLTSHPYPEYHTSKDTPDIISDEALAQAKKFIVKTIEYYEKDFIPERTFKGPLFRSGFGIQTTGKQTNLSWDYLIYSMDGKRTFAELCVEFGLNFEHTYERIERLVTARQVLCCPIDSERHLSPITREELKGL